MTVAVPPLSAFPAIDPGVVPGALDEPPLISADMHPPVDLAEDLERFNARLATYLKPEDIARVGAAYVFSDAAHRGQMRLSGNPYISRRPAVAETLARLAASGRPVSWLTAEPAGCVPGIPALQAGLDDDSTVLGLRTWRHGDERAPAVLGTAHPHGERVCLTPWNRPSTDGVQEP